MARVALALAASAAVHVVIAAVLVVCMEYAPGPKVVATLDFSSVELSLAERDDESSAVAPIPPARPQNLSPRPQTRPPDPPMTEARPLPPNPDALGLKPPDEQIEAMETPVPMSHELVSPRMSPEAPRQARIDAPPRPKRTIRPDYPEGARRRGEQGDVVLELRVDETGAASEVSVAVSSGYVELDESAVRAVRSARFIPAKSDGGPVPSTARIKLTFRLR